MDLRLTSSFFLYLRVPGDVNEIDIICVLTPELPFFARDGEVSILLSPGEDKRMSPGEDKRMSPGEDKRVSPGEDKDERMSPGEDERMSLGEDERMSPGEDERMSPGEDERMSPGEDERMSPGEDKRMAPGKDKMVSPGDRGGLLDFSLGVSLKTLLKKHQPLTFGEHNKKLRKSMKLCSRKSSLLPKHKRARI